ncbi:MAG: uncharacterized protein KVP18_003903 [Porospora cf. gigantea A]|uniref:uncharacterized protein n=1 Tax=Porospora cf. gigantea A TaxID=2853593 RepID=UPI00355ABD8C|nr:MAG: hypothetical protein KVP18_003903 [Porospora cf. gigantea A]
MPINPNPVFYTVKTGELAGTQFRYGGCCSSSDTAFCRAVRDMQVEAAEIKRCNRESPPPLPRNAIGATSYHSVPQPTTMSCFFGAFAGKGFPLMKNKMKMPPPLSPERMAEIQEDLTRKLAKEPRSW